MIILVGGYKPGALTMPEYQVIPGYELGEAARRMIYQITLEPESYQDYERLFFKHSKLSGTGLETAQHYPCPFCAAPDWAIVRVLDVQLLSEKRVCKNCQRGGRARFSNPLGGIAFEFVQTSGPVPPDWLKPEIEREE